MKTNLTVDSIVADLQRFASEPACQTGRTQISYDYEEDVDELFIARYNMKPNCSWASSTTLLVGVFEFGSEKERQESLFRHKAELFLFQLKDFDPDGYKVIHARIKAEAEAKKSGRKSASKSEVPKVALPVNRVAPDVAMIIRKQKNMTEFVEKAVRAYFNSKE